MQAPVTPSQQILIDEIQMFVEALTRRGVPHISQMLRRYLLHRLGAPGMDEDDAPLDLPGTESFLNRVNYFVTRDAAPWDARSRLLRLLMEVDGHGRLLDLYHDLRGRTTEVLPAFEALERSLRKFAGTELDAMYEWYRTGQPGATLEFLRLFTETSFELAKTLFEESERRFHAAEGGQDDLLPEIVVRLEERIFQAGVPPAEAQAILDRMSYLFARLSFETLRRIDDAARQIKETKGITTPLPPGMAETIRGYLEALSDAETEIRAAPGLAEYLSRINARKAIVNQWDKRLLVHIDMRLGLKQYHNTLTEDLMRRSREAAVDLGEALRQNPSGDGSRILGELHHAIDAKLPVASVVEKAVRAEEHLRGVRHDDAPARRLREEVQARLTQIRNDLDAAFVAFEDSIETIRSLVGAARELRAGYRSIIAESQELSAELDELRHRIADRLAADLERLKLPSPGETNRLYRPMGPASPPSS